MQDGNVPTKSLVRLTGGGPCDGGVLAIDPGVPFVDAESKATGRTYRYVKCSDCGGWHYLGEVMKDAGQRTKA